MQSIRTPKRLLVKSKRAKNADLTNSNLKSGLMKSSPLRKKARKKNRKTVKDTEDAASINPDENTNFSYFGKDFMRAKNFKTVDQQQGNCFLQSKSYSNFI